MNKSHRYALWLLTIANLLNYLDRYIISSVAPKIESEFGLSHAQTGFVMSAFMVGYMVSSPFFGWWGDRGSRSKLMGGGVFVWSIATGLCGLVSSYVPLILSRFLVGIGEASYATISPAFIRDKLVDDKLVNKAISFFYTAIPIGAALGYMFGGYMAEHYHWRMAFYIGAIPGFFIGALVFMLKDVERSPVPRSSERPALSGIKSLFRLRNYVVIITGYTAHTFALGGFAAWAPHYSANALGSSLAEASFKIGAITCTAGVVGTLLGGKLSDSFARAHGEFDAMRYVKFCGIVTLIAAPFAAWLLTATTINHFMIAMLFVQIAMFASVAPINTATLAAAPQELSATAFAVQIFVIHALGDVISPPLVGWLSDRMPMNVAMSVLVAAIIVSGLVWLLPLKKSEHVRLSVSS